MKYILVANKKPIVLGRYGENERTTIRFDLNALFPDLLDASFGLVHKRHGDAAPYPCVIENFNGYVSWVINSADVANVGSGTAQLSAYKDGVIAKTEVFTTVTLDSMGLTDPPDPETSWVDDVLQAGILASDAAARAGTYANTAQEVLDDAEGKKEDAEAWAVGERNGEPVDENDPTYHNNAKYYAEQAGGGLSDTAISLLNTILSSAVYETDQTANIAALIAELSGGDVSGVIPPAGGTYEH